jgi:hypothetical protein
LRDFQPLPFPDSLDPPVTHRPDRPGAARAAILR